MVMNRPSRSIIITSSSAETPAIVAARPPGSAMVRQPPRAAASFTYRLPSRVANVQRRLNDSVVERKHTRRTARAPHSHPAAPKAIRAIASMPKMVPTTSALLRTLGRSCT